MESKCKLGLAVRTDFLGKIIPGDTLNYTDYLIKNLYIGREIILFYWKDLDTSNLQLKKHIFRDKEGKAQEINTRINLNEVCNFLYIKQLGPIHKYKQQFLKFLDCLDNFKGIIINSPTTFKNNLSKNYLFFLQEKGIPVIPTIKFSNNKLKEIKDLDFSFSNYYKETPKEIVIKPLNFGEKGQGVRRISDFKSEEEFKEYCKEQGELIIQPFIPEILTEGEYSLVYLGKKFSHGIKKFTGEFLVNASILGEYSEYFPSEEELKLCEKIIESWPDPLGYTRIDLIKHKGKPFVSEVETTNPALYTECNVPSPEKFTPKLEIFLNEFWRENGR